VLTVLDHPLLGVHLTALRDQATAPAEFRRHMDAVARLMVYPVLQDLAVERVAVTTPRGTAAGWRPQALPVLVPVLRAGLGMVDAFLAVLPDATVSHLGLYRDHDEKMPVAYYERFAEHGAAAWGDRPALVLDPMLATGGSAVEAVNRLMAQGAERVALVAVLAAQEGIRRLEARHPAVPVYVTAVDERLDDDGYIVPGLGDAGDRQYGTV
jgi:uracil phosphoribosyltransferase